MKKKFDINKYKTHAGEHRGSPEQWRNVAKEVLGLSIENYLDTLGLQQLPTTEAELKTIYRAKIRQCHPDCTNGSHEAAVRVNAAYALALSSIATRSKRTDTGLRTQRLTPIDECDTAAYINNANWCCQEKKDGKHIIAHAKDGSVVAANKQGLATTIPQHIAKAISKYNDVILDGELIEDTFWVFDALNINDNYHQRYSWLLKNIEDMYPIHIVPAYFTTQDKQTFYNLVKKEGKEGVVFKNLHLNEQLKCKFYATLSAIVDEAITGKSSFKSYVLDDKGCRVDLGHCSALGKRMPQAGDVVEIRYLYCYKKGKLAQAVFLGVRDDVDHSECTIKQLKFK